jgi:hypothetical protein
MSERYQRISCKSSRCEPQSPFRPRADTPLRTFRRAMHSPTRPMMSIAKSQLYEPLLTSVVFIGVAAVTFNGGQRV